jgi:hypothetical protein
VSTRLLLDEMFSPRIATELAARGHDCLAVVADPVARMSSDADLLRRALDNGRALVTNNVVDFERLRRQRHENDDPVPPLICTSDAVFPRDRRFIGRFVGALDHACVTDAVAVAGGVLWLHPAPQ